MAPRILIFIGALCSAFLLEQYLYYEPFVVPKIFQWKEVPLIYWLGAVILEIVVCAAVALRAKSNLEWLLFCLGGAIAVTTIQWTEAIFGMSRAVKLIEGGVVHFLFQCAIYTVVLSATVGAFRAIRWYASAKIWAES